MPLPVVICLYFFHCSVGQYVNHDLGSQTKCVEKVSQSVSTFTSRGAVM